MNEKIMMAMFTTSILSTALLGGIVGVLLNKHLVRDTSD